MHYQKMTSDEPGALSLFHAAGAEPALAAALDRRVPVRPGGPEPGGLALHELRYGWLTSPGGEAVDEVMLARPRDGLRVLATHGGAAVAAAVRACLEAAGFAPAAALAPADPVADPVAAHCLTEAQAAAVLAWRRGAAEPPAALMAVHRVVLAGAPNAGKSSFLNAVSGYERAFVHEEAGATRDAVDELVDVGGYAVWLGDLPGFAGAAGAIETEARRRAETRVRLAEAVWFVADGARPWDGETAAAARAVAATGAPVTAVIASKADLPPAWDGKPWRGVFPDAVGVRVSSLPGGDAAAVVSGLAARLWGRGSSPDPGR